MILCLSVCLSLPCSVCLSLSLLLSLSVSLSCLKLSVIHRQIPGAPSICLSIYLSMSLPVFLSVSLSVSEAVCYTQTCQACRLSVYLSLYCICLQRQLTICFFSLSLCLAHREENTKSQTGTFACQAALQCLYLGQMPVGQKSVLRIAGLKLTLTLVQENILYRYSFQSIEVLNIREESIQKKPITLTRPPLKFSLSYDFPEFAYVFQYEIGIMQMICKLFRIL